MQALTAWVRQQLVRVGEGFAFLPLCAALAFLGTVSAAYPVTVVVVPAVLLVPRRWWSVALCCALGSALAATLLVGMFHHMGWSAVYQQFPALEQHPNWQYAVDLGQQYGLPGLFLVAALPVPQTPALAFFGLSSQSYPAVLLAIWLGKVLKYGTFAWLARRFPDYWAERKKTGTAEAP